MAAMAYPSDLRGRGGQIATVSQSLGGIVGLYAFPNMVDAYGLSTTITIFAIVPLIGVVICRAIMWEPFDEGDAVALEAEAQIGKPLEGQAR